jgi:hypothetical protein
MPGLGDLISGSGNTLNQIAAAMKPPSPAPNPNPGAQGAPPAGGGNQMAPPPGQPQQQPSTAPASPPDLASLYIKLSQQDRAADMFNRSLAGMQASLAPPGQQAAWLGSAPPMQDAGVQIGNLMKIQQAQTAAQEHQQAAAGAEGAFKALFPDAAPGTGTELFNLGKLPDVLSNHFANMNPTEAQKNADAATKAYGVANPNASASDLASFKANLLAGAMGGSDLDQRQYLSAVQSGIFKGSYQDWKNQNAASGKQLGDYATEKANAIETFPSLDKSYGTAEQNIDWLAAHPEATIKAVQWGSAAGGRVGQVAGAFGVLDQDTKDARSYLDQLGDVNFRAGLTDVKNVRSQSEATKIGGSVTNLDKPQNSPALITGELTRLQGISQSAHANLTAAAGKEVPYKYRNQVDSTYLDPKSPLYNGATIETPVDMSKMNEADADAAVAGLPKGRSFIGPDGQPHTKN